MNSFLCLAAECRPTQRTRKILLHFLFLLKKPRFQTTSVKNVVLCTVQLHYFTVLFKLFDANRTVSRFFLLHFSCFFELFPSHTELFQGSPHLQINPLLQYHPPPMFPILWLPSLFTTKVLNFVCKIRKAIGADAAPDAKNKHRQHKPIRHTNISISSNPTPHTRITPPLT